MKAKLLYYRKKNSLNFGLLYIPTKCTFICYSYIVNDMSIKWKLE